MSLPSTGPHIPTGGAWGYTPTSDPLYDSSSHALALASLGIEPLPSSTELTLYFSNGSKASDSNDGLSWGTAKASIAGAIAQAGGSPALLQGGYGTFTVSTPDVNGNGVSLSNAGTRLCGLGFGLTTVNVIVPVTWAIQARAQLCSVENIFVTVSGLGTAVYGVGVSTPTAVGSCEHCTFDHVWVNAATTVTSAFAVGPDHPASSSMDIAYTEFRHCYFNGVPGAITNGWLVGNGTSGNVLLTMANLCGGGPAVFGVTLAGAGVQWFGGGFTHISSADIQVTHGHPGDIFAFYGVRSENGNKVLSVGYVGANSGFVLDDYLAGGYTPSDGSTIISYGSGGPLTLRGGSYETTAHTTIFAINPSTGVPPVTFTAIAVVSDSTNPYPVANAKVSRTILSAQTTNAGTTLPQLIPAFACVVDGKAQIGGSVPVVTGSRGANVALASLLTALVSTGLITDGSVP